MNQDTREPRLHDERPYSTLSPLELRALHRTPAIQQVVRELDAGNMLTDEQIQAFSEHFANRGYYDVTFDPIPIKKGESILFEKDLFDDGDDNAIAVVLAHILASQKLKDPTSLVLSLTRMTQSTDEVEVLAYLSAQALKSNLGGAQNALTALMGMLGRDSRYQQIIRGEMVDPEHEEEARNLARYIDEFALEALRQFPEEWSLAVSALEDEQMILMLREPFLGLSYERHDDILSTLLSASRKKLQDASLASDQVHRLERMTRLLMGFDPDSDVVVHRSTDSIYAKIPFEVYDANEAAQPVDMEVLQSVLAARNGAQLIIDAGCGTGRLANAIPSTNSDWRVVAFDTSPENLEKAREQADLSGVSDQVQYVRADWEHIPVADGASDVLYCLGRSLTHTENRDNFMSALREFRRTLRPDGVLIFDMPDPERGSVHAARERQIRALESSGVIPTGSVGVDDEGYSIQDFDCLVDSPNGVDFYNRYIPGRARLEMLVHMAGFSLVELRSAPIQGYNYTPDDRNIYFEARPLSTPLATYDRSAPSQASPNQDRAESAMV